jgi:hypothetical protein
MALGTLYNAVGISHYTQSNGGTVGELMKWSKFDRVRSKYPGTGLLGLRKNLKALVRTDGVPVENRIQHLQRINTERYRCTNLLGMLHMRRASGFSKLTGEASLPMTTQTDLRTFKVKQPEVI